METVSNWEGEWSMSQVVGPNSMSAGPTPCCFDGGAAQQQLPTNQVDQLLLLDGVGASDSDLSGQSFDYGVMGIRPSNYLSPASTDSGSSLPLWTSTVPAYSSLETGRFHHNNNTTLPLEQATAKRKRDPDPDPDLDLDQEKFTIIGSGSAGYTNSNASFKLIRDTKWSELEAHARNISFQQQGQGGSAVGTEEGDVDAEAIQQMKEMIYRAAALRPVNLGEEVLAFKPRRKNVRISSDPQTVAARQRRERISERLRLLQKLVPGGCKMDTASMLDEAANYLKFLRSQIKALQSMPASTSTSTSNRMMPPVTTFNLANYYDHHHLPAAPINIPTMHLPDNNHLLLPHHHNPTTLIHH